MTAPYIPLFHTDHLAKTRFLTHEQHSVYVKLFIVMWEKGGFLEANNEALYKYSGLTKKQWDKNKEIILDLFDFDKNVYFDKKLLEFCKKYEEKVEKNKINGSKGGRANSLKNKETPAANAQANASANAQATKPNHNHIDSDKDKSSSESNKGNDFEFSESLKSDFQDFWKKYPNRVKEKLAKTAYETARKQYSHEKIMDGLALYIDAKPPDRAWMNPNNFLNDERFNDEPSNPIKTQSNNGYSSKNGYSNANSNQPKLVSRADTALRMLSEIP